ncbi:MAG TPA: alkaline phosphatase family protein [Thermoanaerobaculia bacterium]
MPRSALLLVFSVGLSLAAGCSPQPDPEPPPAGTPRLLVFVVVDQLGMDTLERVRPLLAADGGLRRRVEEGVVYSEAHHGHAVTYTAPGHAALATGQPPAVSGIVANEWLDREAGEAVGAEEQEDGRVGPGRMLVSSIGDWIRSRYPAARVVAASGKSRGAVFLGGEAADGVFWYDAESGAFASSAVDGEEAPWLAGFNDRGLPPELFSGAAWAPLPVDAEAARAVGFEAFDRGPFDRGLPRLLGGFDWVPRGGYYGAVYRSPFVDEHLARLARVLIVEEELGGDEWPDLLGLSFSALDNVGHAYGPTSLEALDVLVRLDRALGELFALFDQRVGRGAWLVGFASDHGVAPVPEIAAAGGGANRRAGAPEVTCLRRAVAAVAERFGVGAWLADDGYLDRRFLAERGVDPAEVEAAADALLAACPGIDAVWTRREIAALPPGPRPVPGSPGWLPALYRNTWHPERSPDLLLQTVPDFLPIVGSQTTHASPHPHDTHVPIVLWRPGLPAATVTEPVLTVDLAPTLARLLGVPVPDGLAGRPLPLPAAAEVD